jgi:hypothetical protein
MIVPILNVAATNEPKNMINQSPTKPMIEGPTTAKIGVTCFYTVISSDPQGDDLYYEVQYSDDPSLNIRGGPFKSGEKITFAHCWDDFYQDYNPFVIKVKAVDEDDHESEWGKLEINITNAKIKVNNLFLQFIENHPNFITLILKIIKPR